MRSPYNLTAGERRYIQRNHHVVDNTDLFELGLNEAVVAYAFTDKLATQIADALELVDRMRNHQ